MNARTPTIPKEGAALPQKAPKPRISPKLRHAIKIRVEEGRTILEACEIAGLSEAGWHKAMKRPAVQQHLEAVQALFIREIDRRRERYRAQAIEVAHSLMKTAQSEAVRMRAVEFFAGESRKDAAPQVNVQINQTLNGYEYVRPGQRVVDITDKASVEPSPEGPANTED